ncbi:MAG: hypothetical protein PHW12_01590 [Smithella sp.]|nr:hypothetical protein [Smithella sp.]MDD5672862.1 hypothetical protein [Chitinivibrionales bacterium]
MIWRLLVVLLFCNTCGVVAAKCKSKPIDILNNYILQDTSFNRAKNTATYAKFRQDFLDTSAGIYGGFDVSWVIDSMVYVKRNDSIIEAKVHFLGEFASNGFYPEEKNITLKFRFIKKMGCVRLIEPQIPNVLFPWNVWGLISLHGLDTAEMKGLDAIEKFKSQSSRR